MGKITEKISLAPFLPRLFLALAISLLVAACGFHLRGAVQLPYANLYVAVSASSTLGMELRRQLRASQPDLLVENEKQAEAIFRQLSDHRERIIAAINADGRAREYQLRLSYSFRLEDAKGAPLTPVSQIIIAREITYDDNQVLSKDQEEAFLWLSMEKELAQQILRRLATQHPLQPAQPPEQPPEEKRGDADGDA
ncbi:MAG: LPS assembly lipoprotein LptE [Zoogloeaceae bacterium]|nr:LPS assembly lipoprotein LptE [Zoogloeaceae bacterium]